MLPSKLYPAITPRPLSPVSAYIRSGGLGHLGRHKRESSEQR